MALIIKAVGDIAPGDCSVNGIGIGSVVKEKGPGVLFEKIGGMLNGGDLLLGNLEGSLSKKIYDQNLRLCGTPEIALALRQQGFDVLSVANNHSFDHGPDIFYETVKYCSKAGLEISGLRGGSDYYCKPVIFEKNSEKIGILAYNWIGIENITDMGRYQSAVKDGVVNYTWNRDRDENLKRQSVVRNRNKNVILDIQKLKKVVDIVIIMPHWGMEWSIYPPYGVILEARSFVDAGANMIIGSHSHAPQGIEVYNDSLIAYSLGNFIWDEVADIFSFGIVLTCEIDDRRVINFDVDFVKRTKKYFQLLPASIEEKKIYVNMLDKSSCAITSNKAFCLLDDDRIYHEYEKQYNRVKFRTFLYFLKKIPTHPFLIKVFFIKLYNFIKIVIMRVKGVKVKW